MNTKHEWRNTHQPWELRYHQNSNFRWNDASWNNQWDKVFIEFMELTPSYFTNEDILVDIGCGSRPCLDWFNEGTVHHLDPLLNDFLEVDRMKPHWENKPLLYSQPAEQLVENLVDKCDYVHCWNVLDHTYDWRQILENISLYSKKGGLVLLGTDLSSTPHVGHPGIDSRSDFFSFINKHFTVIKSKDRFHHREIALKMEKK